MPLLVLAPLAGVTDSPFRRLLRGLGADLCFSEMLSSEALVRESSKTLGLMRFEPAERPLIFQLFGADPKVMGEAAGILSDYEIDGIDINLGCPDPKVLKSGAGGALLADLPRLRAVLEAVKAAARLPVSCKLRSSYDGGVFAALETARIAQDLGYRMVTLHPRTVKQGFRGQARWEQIRALKEQVQIPVIANGDVKQAKDVLDILEVTGADAVMIGRAAWENPWIFRQAKILLEGRGIVPPLAGCAPTPTTEERLALALEHARLLQEFYGERAGRSLAPRFLCRYLKGFEEAAALRQEITRAGSFEELFNLLEEYIFSAGINEDRLLVVAGSKEAKQSCF